MSATIRLERIQEPSFNDFLETMLPLYIEERSAADHVSKTVAEQFAHQRHAELLPHGYHTPGHYFARIIDKVTNGAVGAVWFRLDTSSGEAYIYYIMVAPEHRRRGYASAALNAVANIARSKGCARLALNVFARNEIAQSLYRKLGFHVVSLHMNKPL
jgi:ribosomal protein S18 acetylase RimI-like enzyme